MKKKAISGGRRAYILTMRILMGAAAVITAAPLFEFSQRGCVKPYQTFAFTLNSGDFFPNIFPSFHPKGGFFVEGGCQPDR